MKSRYGESRMENCVMCSKQALSLNMQGFPVCNNHKSASLPELKCLCGEYLMIMDGKFGKFFQCLNCGNINIRKALEINEGLIKKSDNNNNNNNSNNNKSDNESNKGKSNAVYVREIKNPVDKTIRSDDPDYFD